MADRRYPDRLWDSADAYFNGQDFRNAARVLRKYTKNETRRRHPQALVALGEALLALDESDNALATFQECIALHPRDVASYRARLLASHVYADQGDFQQAEAMLQENLSGEHLTPDSREWRDSLFALGELLHDQGRYREGILRLEEAVQRYGEVPQSLVARYLIADSCLHMAETIQAGLAQEKMTSRRAAQLAQVRQLTEKGLGQYQRVQNTLAVRDESELTPHERAMLRNSQFAVGEIAFTLHEYEAAVRAYTTVVNRWEGAAETLDAYVRLAEAYERLGRHAEAHSTLKQAEAGPETDEQGNALRRNYELRPQAMGRPARLAEQSVTRKRRDGCSRNRHPSPVGPRQARVLVAVARLGSAAACLDRRGQSHRALGFVVGKATSAAGIAARAAGARSFPGPSPRRAPLAIARATAPTAPRGSNNARRCCTKFSTRKNRARP